VNWLALVERHASVISTMEVARQRALAGAPEGTTVLAQHQSAGRGRRGRTWQSPSGAGLWMTTLLRPGRPMSQLPLHTLSLVAGVALLDAVQRYSAQGVQLKWPNDLVVGSRKLAGILLEGEALSSDAPAVLVGMGLNVSAADALPAELQASSIGLAELVAAPISTEGVLEQVLLALAAWYGRWQREGAAPVLARWRRADALFGKQVRVDGESGSIEGVADGVSPIGELRVRTAVGPRLVAAGEVERLLGGQRW